MRRHLSRSVRTARRQSAPVARLLVLADDFTGACDAAGAWAAFRRTIVVTASPRSWPADIDVLAIDLDVRERSAVDAYKMECVAPGG